MTGLIRRLATRGVTALAALNRRLAPPAGPHPFLAGVHAPMEREITLGELEIEGRIPPEFDGRYLRIGPNLLDPDPRSYHWFVGDGMVHGVRLRQGRALWYRSRRIRSRRVAALTGAPAARGPRHGGFDTVNTNVVGHAGTALALVEAGSTPVSLDEELDGQTYRDFGGTLTGSFSAHPHRDPATFTRSATPPRIRGTSAMSWSEPTGASGASWRFRFRAGRLSTTVRSPSASSSSSTCP